MPCADEGPPFAHLALASEVGGGGGTGGGVVVKVMVSGRWLVPLPLHRSHTVLARRQLPRTRAGGRGRDWGSPKPEQQSEAPAVASAELERGFGWRIQETLGSDSGRFIQPLSLQVRL